MEKLKLSPKKERERRKLLQKEFESYNLSKTEIKVLKLVCQEFTTLEISKKLKMSRRTVEGHRYNINAKIQAKTQIGLYVFCLHYGLIKPLYWAMN
jgi:DNA-binding CsgD family transcriptional regulator